MLKSYYDTQSKDNANMTKEDLVDVEWTAMWDPTPVNLVVRKHSLFDLMKIDHEFDGDNDSL